jgi:hypothetical protein
MTARERASPGKRVDEPYLHVLAVVVAPFDLRIRDELTDRLLDFLVAVRRIADNRPGARDRDGLSAVVEVPR